MSLSFIFGRGRCAQHHVYIELPGVAFRYISVLRTAAAAAGRKRLASCCVAPLLFARERSNKRDDLFKRVAYRRRPSNNTYSRKSRERERYNRHFDVEFLFLLYIDLFLFYPAAQRYNFFGRYTFVYLRPEKMSQLFTSAKTPKYTRTRLFLNL